jgi:hypothetical protein
MNNAGDDSPLSSDRAQIGGEIGKCRRFVHSDQKPKREAVSVVHRAKPALDVAAIKQRVHHVSPALPATSSLQVRTRPARQPSGPSRTASPTESPERSNDVPVARHAAHRSASSPSGLSSTKSPTSCGRSVGANASAKAPSQTLGSTRKTSRRSGDSPGELRAEIIASTRTTRSRYGQSAYARRRASPTTRRRRARTRRNSPPPTHDLIGPPLPRPPVTEEPCTPAERSPDRGTR